MTENPEEWKTAVDPNTGRTYWYHRKTRVSSWTKPNFRENPPNMTMPQPEVGRDAAVGVSSHQYEQQLKPHTTKFPVAVNQQVDADSGVLRFMPRSHFDIEVQLQ
eukprot:gene45306-55429_t